MHAVADGLRADFESIDKELRNRIGENRDRLPLLPSTDESSTDPDVVERRKMWIENYLQLSFQFLDEAMSTRTDGSDNQWETFTYAKNWCATAADQWETSSDLMVVSMWPG